MHHHIQELAKTALDGQSEISQQTPRLHKVVGHYTRCERKTRLIHRDETSWRPYPAIPFDPQGRASTANAYTLLLVLAVSGIARSRTWLLVGKGYDVSAQSSFSAKREQYSVVL